MERRIVRNSSPADQEGTPGNFMEGLDMLVLSRREGERIVIGRNIELTITAIASNKVSIGIEAPRSVNITRGELLEANYGECDIRR